MGRFKYEDCLLKHYIRTQAWLPLCRARKAAVNPKGTQRTHRRELRYFTFCAAGAIDVLMLDVAGVLHPDGEGHFSTVCFFDRTREDVIETQKRIPGAIGIPGEFTEIVLSAEPGADPLAPPTNERDEESVRQKKIREESQLTFREMFPFDVINLDLEGFAFRPNDDLPGKLINSLRKVFEWQREMHLVAGGNFCGFSLMFTTQIGPPNLSEDYIQMLTSYLDDNIVRDPILGAELRVRSGCESPTALKNGNFEMFFKLALPKTILHTLLEEDWYIDPATGVDLYVIERNSKSGPYKMLHAVMDVRRQTPTKDKRAPNTTPPAAAEAHQLIARGIFTSDVVTVTEALVGEAHLVPELGEITKRGLAYMNPGP